MGQRQCYDRFNMESSNTISSEWNKSHQSVLDDCQTQKNKNISRFFYCVQRKWVIDKSYGRFSMKSENTISNKWNDSHQSVLDNFWTQKTRIFCVFDCEMQRKWVRDKSYGRFSMQSKNTISNKWNDSYQSVLDDLWAQKTTIFRVFH